jgi:hypothetical protein
MTGKFQSSNMTCCSNIMGHDHSGQSMPPPQPEQQQVGAGKLLHVICRFCYGDNLKALSEVQMVQCCKSGCMLHSSLLYRIEGKLRQHGAQDHQKHNVNTKEVIV